MSDNILEVHAVLGRSSAKPGIPQPRCRRHGAIGSRRCLGTDRGDQDDATGNPQTFDRETDKRLMRIFQVEKKSGKGEHYEMQKIQCMED